MRLCNASSSAASKLSNLFSAAHPHPMSSSSSVIVLDCVTDRVADWCLLVLLYLYCYGLWIVPFPWPLSLLVMGSNVIKCWILLALLAPTLNQHFLTVAALLVFQASISAVIRSILFEVQMRIRFQVGERLLHCTVST